MRCESRFYGVAIDEVDSPSEEIFEEELEVHVGVKGTAPFLELDEDIDVALFTLFAPGKRSEDPDPPGAKAPDPFAVFCQRTEDAASRKHGVSYSCDPPIWITLFPRVAGRRVVPAGIRHPGEHFPLVRGLRHRKAPVQVEHLLHEGDHVVTAGGVGGVVAAIVRVLGGG